MSGNDSEQLFSPLVAAVFEHRAKDTASAVNAVINTLEHENKRLKATLALIRIDVTRLVTEPMTLMLGRDLLDVLEPDDSDIDYYIKNELEG